MFKQQKKELLIKKPDAVLFDTDNTLYEYSIANKKALESAANKAENLLGITKEDFYRYFSEARNQIKSQLGRTASSHSRLLYFQRMLEIVGYKAQLIMALDLEQTFWRTFLANAPLFEGVLEFIEALRFDCIPIGVVTDLTAHIQFRKLCYFNLEDTFDAVVCSEEIGADKPDPKNFTLALKKMEIYDYTNVWIIGDDIKSDIEGGKNIGAITFHKINDSKIQYSLTSNAEFIFTSFIEFKQFYENINS